MADFSINVVLRMLFLSLNNAGIYFIEKKFIWKSYIIQEILSINQRVKLIDKKEFVKVVLNKNIEYFAIYMVFFSFKILIYLTQNAQIALLITENVIIPIEYTNFVWLFLKKIAKILLK